MTHPRRLRALLACLFALAFAVVLGGGGCANGGDTSGGGGDDGSGGDVTTEGGETGGEASGCTGGKTLCGTTCTSTGNDPKNCGKCGNACPTGQVCSAGMCGYSCGSGETLCGLPPEGGSGMDATGTAETGAKDAASGGDTGASEAGAVDSGGTTDAGGTTDSGNPNPSTPYCSNTNNDPNNCGGCGIVCPPMYACDSSSCTLMCGPGTIPCVTSGTCIPSGSCCSTGDCTVSGEICPMPGGTCQCPGGEKQCPKTNSCISSNDCCTNADCKVAGSTCTTAGQACSCAMSGYKACIAFNACLPDADCCIPSDCSAPNVNVYTCTPSPAPPQTPTSSACGIQTCSPGCYDVNGTYTDGCECCDDTLSKTCGAPTGLGQLTLGQNVQKSGSLPGMGESDWIQVTFSNEGNKAFHALVTLSNNPGNAFAFDIDSNCAPTPLPCGEGGTCNGKTTWEVSYGAQATGNPGDPSWQPIAAIGTVLIRVYRVTGGPTCDTWTLSVSE